MLTLRHFRRIRNAFISRAQKARFPVTPALRKEYEELRNAVTSAIQFEQKHSDLMRTILDREGIKYPNRACKPVLILPDETPLGKKSEQALQAWVAWLMAKDPEGKYADILLPPAESSAPATEKKQWLL